MSAAADRLSDRAEAAFDGGGDAFPAVRVDSHQFFVPLVGVTVAFVLLADPAVVCLGDFEDPGFVDASYLDTHAAQGSG